MKGFSILSNVSEDMNDRDIVKAIEKDPQLEKLVPSKIYCRVIVSTPFNKFCSFC